MIFGKRRKNARTKNKEMQKKSLSQKFSIHSKNLRFLKVHKRIGFECAQNLFVLMLTKVNDLMSEFRKCGGGVNGTLSLWQERFGICGKFQTFVEFSQASDSNLPRV